MNIYLIPAPEIATFFGKLTKSKNPSEVIPKFFPGILGTDALLPVAITIFLAIISSINFPESSCTNTEC